MKQKSSIFIISCLILNPLVGSRLLKQLYRKRVEPRNNRSLPCVSIPIFAAVLCQETSPSKSARIEQRSTGRYGIRRSRHLTSGIWNLGRKKRGEIRKQTPSNKTKTNLQTKQIQARKEAKKKCLTSILDSAIESDNKSADPSNSIKG